MSEFRSRQRIANYGEVFTSPRIVVAMLDLVCAETERIDARFLEPACGSGNFLVQILGRKLTAVERKFGRSEFERRHYSLLAVMSTYGIELLADNIAECKNNMLEVLAARLDLAEEDELLRAAASVLELNLIHGDALRMRTVADEPITLAEWGYLGKGKFQRRDFRLDVLRHMSTFKDDNPLFASLGKHEVFTPIRTFAPLTLSEFAAAAFHETEKEPR